MQPPEKKKKSFAIVGHIKFNLQTLKLSLQRINTGAGCREGYTHASGGNLWGISAQEEEEDDDIIINMTTTAPSPLIVCRREGGNRNTITIIIICNILITI